MSTPSTTSYIPFDSAAPAVFSQVRMNDYLIVAFVVLLLYDHILTLDKEVEWTWTLRWRLPKILFIINRYVLTPLLLLNAIPNLNFHLSISFCTFDLPLSLGQTLLNFGTAELLIIIRVCSLYGNRKAVIWSFYGFFSLALISAAVLQTRLGLTLHLFLYYKFLPGCWTWITSSNMPQWPVWVTFLSFEGVLILLTAYKLFSYHNQMNRIITVLARDSIAYFIIVFACLACLLIHDLTDLRVNLQIPGQCITSIAVGRMMMNIRGLILDDPEHTIHLRTLQFAECTNSGSEIEGVA